MKRVMIFDLDETIINSSHRTPNNPDGTLNLEKYFELKSRENIFQDTLLPLADFFKNLDRTQNYVIICTARVMNQDDFDYLEAMGLHYHAIYSRATDGSENGINDGKMKARKIGRLKNLNQFCNLPFYMWDDANVVIAAMRRIGVNCFNAIKVNGKLAPN